jgi:hypothetical protein
MAVFIHGNRTINYQIQFAPFAHDLVLLQGSRLSLDFWAPVLEQLKGLPSEQGRIVACDWFQRGLSEAEMATDLLDLLKTLALQDVHVVACEDAVALVKQVERQDAKRFSSSLLYPSTPRSEDLSRSVQEFSDL